MHATLDDVLTSFVNTALGLTLWWLTRESVPPALASRQPYTIPNNPLGDRIG